jgi:hypothetical protein
MFRRLLALSALLIVVPFAACKKDAEIGSVLKELDVFTNDLVQKIDSAQGSIEGIDAAQQFLDSKKGDLNRKLATVREARGFQVSDATKKTMTDSFTKNITAVASLQIKYVTRSVKDPVYKSKIEKLVNDYRDLLTGGAKS